MKKVLSLILTLILVFALLFAVTTTALADDGGVWAAAGTPAAVYRYDPKKGMERVGKLPAAHVLDIALHGKDGPVRIQDVAKRQGLSIKYLEKLIRILKKSGYITSKRGPKGGHMPAVPLEKITVGAVVRRLEGDARLVECSSDDNCCANEPLCLTRSVWKAAANAMFEKLDTITFADLVEEMRHIHTDKKNIPDFLPNGQEKPKAKQ